VLHYKPPGASRRDAAIQSHPTPRRDLAWRATSPLLAQGGLYAQDAAIHASRQGGTAVAWPSGQIPAETSLGQPGTVPYSPTAVLRPRKPARDHVSSDHFAGEPDRPRVGCLRRRRLRLARQARVASAGPGSQPAAAGGAVRSVHGKRHRPVRVSAVRDHGRLPPPRLCGAGGGGSTGAVVVVALPAVVGPPDPAERRRVERV
jgi:hypothetical protein